MLKNYKKETISSILRCLLSLIKDDFNSKTYYLLAVGDGMGSALLRCKLYKKAHLKRSLRFSAVAVIKIVVAKIVIIVVKLSDSRCLYFCPYRFYIIDPPVVLSSRYDQYTS